MKLRTKITLICSIAILITMLLTDSIILFFSAKTVFNDATQSGLMESYEAFTNLAGYIQEGKPSSDNSIKYLLKTSCDDYTVCFAGENHKELHNNTVFSYRQLADGSFSPSEAEISYKRMCYAERRLLVFRKVWDGYTLFHIIDLQPIINKYTSMVCVCLSASIIIALISIFIVAFLMRRFMKPLMSLSSYASKMADGDYSQRIIIENNDEVGQLSIEFNKMADAIEKRTEDLKIEINKRKLFMGNLTHELKTPIAAISGYAQTMQRAKLTEEEQGCALSYINSECMRLSHLSKKMMNLLELDNTFSPQLEYVYVNELFENVKKTCMPIASEKNVVITAIPSNAALKTDLELLTDVLINLTDNAIKASPHNEQVMLYVKNNSLIVEDYGCGIPKEDIEKVTEPFYTVDRSRSRKNGGIGLGLAISGLIIEKLGMKINIESVVGKGTKITIYNLIMD